jgi:hypothetical protein
MAGEQTNAGFGSGVAIGPLYCFKFRLDRARACALEAESQSRSSKGAGLLCRDLRRAGFSFCDGNLPKATYDLEGDIGGSDRMVL